MEPTTRDKLFHIVYLIEQQIIAVFFLLILWEVFKNLSVSNVGTWHIVLCVFGVAVCMVQALLIFSKEGISRGTDRTTRATYHGLWMFLGCLCVTVGISLKIYQKGSEIKHFTTTHAILGLLAWILILLSVIGGLLTSTSKRFSYPIRPIWLKGGHIILGVIAFIIGVVALGYGLNYLEMFTGSNGKTALLVFLIIYVLYSLIGAVLTLFNLFFR